MSLYHCKSTAHHGGYRYESSFIVSTRDGETLPDNIDQILTAFEFNLFVSDVEKNWDEDVWSDSRVVRCWVDKEIHESEFPTLIKCLDGVSLYTILDTVEFGDKRDEEWA